MDGSLRIGIHASISGSYVNALESASKRCNALQIFCQPRMWAGGPSRTTRMPRRFAPAAKNSAGPLVIHANYLINLAGTQPMLRTRSIQAFHDELVALRWAPIFWSCILARAVKRKSNRPSLHHRKRQRASRRVPLASCAS
jgi:endonuclease IV